MCSTRRILFVLQVLGVMVPFSVFFFLPISVEEPSASTGLCVDWSGLVHVIPE